MTSKVEFTVTGEVKIHCASCEHHISNALVRLPGVEKAWASASSQRVGVIIDPGVVGAEQVQARLQLLGYQAEPREGAS